MKQILIAAIIFIVLSGCMEPGDRVTDSQTKTIADLCDKKGMVAQVHNTVIVSTVKCARF